MRRSPYHSLPAQVKNAIKDLKESDNLLKDEDVLISVKRHAIDTEVPRHRQAQVPAQGQQVHLELALRSPSNMGAPRDTSAGVYKT